MIAFPNCKINLGLHVVHKRSDGYHDLQTVFYPLPLRDVLEVIKESATGNRQSAINISGLSVQGNIEDNLCIKAYRLLQKDFPQLPPVQFYLHKAIPMGAGLGGGSADGAFTLLLLNEKFQLELTTEKLLEYAGQLGSDCPFFIINKPCLATGRGELLQPLSLDLSAYSFVLVHPGIHISTNWAFAQLTPAVPAQSIKEIIQLPIQQWKERLVNDFEKPVFVHYPELAGIKQQLYDAGAIYAAMSGSGSSFFGIFPKGTVKPELFAGKYSTTIL